MSLTNLTNLAPTRDNWERVVFIFQFFPIVSQRYTCFMNYKKPSYTISMESTKGKVLNEIIRLQYFNGSEHIIQLEKPRLTAD